MIFYNNGGFKYLISFFQYSQSDHKNIHIWFWNEAHIHIYILPSSTITRKSRIWIKMNPWSLQSSIFPPDRILHVQNSWSFHSCNEFPNSWLDSLLQSLWPSSISLSLPPGHLFTCHASPFLISNLLHWPNLVHNASSSTPLEWPPTSWPWHHHPQIRHRI